MYEDKRQHISNIRSAIPPGIVDASKRVKPPPGKIPDSDTLRMFYYEKR